MTAALAWIAANPGVMSAIGSAFSAVSSIAASSQQAQAQRFQAQQAELQGRQNALNYNKQANAVLDRQQQLAAMARARAAAGGIDPLTGSPMTIQQVDAMRAGEEAQIARENAQMAIYGGLAQSQSLQAAASATQQIGLLSAVGTAATGFSKYQDVKVPQSSGSYSVGTGSAYGGSVNSAGMFTPYRKGM